LSRRSEGRRRRKRRRLVWWWPPKNCQLRPRHLTLEHLQLVSQEQDLHFFPLLRTTEQQQQLQQAAQQPIGETKFSSGKDRVRMAGH
jgi:hypothetical protein